MKRVKRVIDLTVTIVLLLAVFSTAIGFAYSMWRDVHWVAGLMAAQIPLAMLVTLWTANEAT